MAKAPRNAPAMTARNPERLKTPAEIILPPASITNATPRLAPELIPKMEGSARGLLKTVCSISPATASPAPHSNAVMHCGTRDSQIIKLQLAFSASPPVSIS